MKQIFIFLTIVSIVSCDKNQSSVENTTLSTEQIDSILTEYRFEYESPIILDSARYALIPISTKLLGKRTKYTSDGYYSEDYPRYWNVLFYNLRTGETQLLTDSKIRISRIHTSKDDEYEKVNNMMEERILYEIGDIDFNKDEKLTGEDPEYLFSSEINGNNLIRISPINEDLQYFEIVPKSGQILFKTLRDLNNDLVFNKANKHIWYKAELVNNEWETKELFDSTMRDSIENLYFDQWLNKR